jgi:hypothetical protein
MSLIAIFLYLVAFEVHVADMAKADEWKRKSSCLGPWNVKE